MSQKKVFNDFLESHVKIHMTQNHSAPTIEACTIYIDEYVSEDAAPIENNKLTKATANSLKANK